MSKAHTQPSRPRHRPVGPTGQTPPRWAERLIEGITAPHLREEIQGDLDELFQGRVQRYGHAKARLLYVVDVILLLHPRLWRSQSRSLITPPHKNNNPYHQPFSLHPDMLRNYFKIAWRNLIRNKAFSAINIVGLALGMASSLLIFFWIQDELNVGRYHANGPQLYHVMERTFNNGQVEAQPATPGLLSDALKQDLSEVVHAAGFTGWNAQMTFAVGDKAAKEQGEWAGADWFKMFSVPLLAGTPQTALSSPTSLAISRKVAENYFGSPQAALGQSVRIDNKTDYQVTAVFENLPAASIEKYDFLLSWQDVQTRNAWIKDWGQQGTRTLIQLRPDARMTTVEAKLRPFLKKYRKGLDAHFDMQLFLHAYPDTYLYATFTSGYPDGGRIEYVWLFGIVAVFILLIACINFMNLATALSVKRAREVGVRKVVGAVRSLLIGQFIGEAMLLTLLALVMALGLVLLLLPAFNSLTGKQVELDLIHGSFWAVLLGITLITGLLAGSYPALFLSSLNPVRVLKGSLRFGSGARLFRQGLVVFQFVLSILLMVGMIVVYRQVNMVQTKNLGFQRSNLIYLPAEGNLVNKFETFKQELLAMPGIEQVSYLRQSPTGISSMTDWIEWPGKVPNTSTEFAFTSAGYDLAKTLQVRVQGREFSPSFGSDSANFIINQTMAKRIGYAEPVGKPLTMWGKPGTIIGVMDDFHFQSLHIPIQPLIVRFDPYAGEKTILIRARPGQTRHVLTAIQTLSRQFNPQLPFIYQFADDEYQKLYKSETVVGILANYFAVLAIFISCLGLFGLATFMAEQRTKEIGVRKVLGASVTSVVRLLAGDFLKPILIAIVIASPLAWYAMHQWLQGFAYRIDIDWWIFALAGSLAVGIAMLTVSFQSVKAALMNPVKSLRAE